MSVGATLRIGELDPELTLLARAARGAGQPALPDLGVALVRARVAAGDVLCSDGPPVEVVDSTIDGPAGALRLRTYRSPDTRLARVVVYLHGGGWVTGDLDYSDEVCRHLAAGCGATVVSVDYRLAPEHPFPAALHDAWAALCWSAETHPRAGGLIVAGDSAGGALAAGISARARTEGLCVDGQVLVYPVLDGAMDTASYVACADAFPLTAGAMAWFWQLYAPDEADRSAEFASPGRDGDLRGLPATVLVQAGHDPLRDEGESCAARACAAGVPVEILRFPTLGHGFLRFTGACTAARAALAEVVAAAARLFARPSGRSTS